LIKFDKRLMSILIILLALSGAFVILQGEMAKKAQTPATFDAQRAYNDVVEQMALGPRTPGSQAHADVIRYIQSELKSAGWKVTIQKSTFQGHEIQNIIASHGDTTEPATILGAHYDSRLKADRDADSFLTTLPVPGANDGASGVAVLLELSRVMPAQTANNVWLVFFDAEDQGNIDGWDWILGSSAYADALTVTPEALVLLDMIGDADLNIYREVSSDTTLKNEIWLTAARLGYSDQFINTEKYNMIDDHTPFLDKGIHAVDLIDFDYPYWHTIADTADKVSPQSLEIVGNVLLTWLQDK
jgi:Zn-dependent M28 family amino/carboxypeptidase